MAFVTSAPGSVMIPGMGSCSLSACAPARTGAQAVMMTPRSRGTARWIGWRIGISSLTRPDSLRFRLFEPESHVHLTEQRCRRGELLLSLLRAAGALTQPPQTDAAVGHERPHLQFLRERDGLTVRFNRCRRVWWLVMRRGLGDE